MPCSLQRTSNRTSRRVNARGAKPGSALSVGALLVISSLLTHVASAQTRPPEIKEKERSDPAAGEVVIINPRKSATPAPDPYAPIKLRPLTDDAARAAEAKAKKPAANSSQPATAPAATAQEVVKLPPLPSRSRHVAPPAPDDRVTRNDSDSATRDRLRQFQSIGAAPRISPVPEPNASAESSPLNNPGSGLNQRDRQAAVPVPAPDASAGVAPGPRRDFNDNDAAPRGDRNTDSRDNDDNRGREINRADGARDGDDVASDQALREERARADRRRRQLARQSGYEPDRARGDRDEQIIRYRREGSREGRERPWRLCRELAWRCDDGFEGACFRWRRNCS